MIDINLNNYEEIVIDYFDEKLNTSEIEQLMSFLNKYPEIKEEFKLYGEYEKVKDKEHELSTITKNKLKKIPLLKHTSNSNLDELCIAKIENDLTEKENLWFDELISNDVEKKNELDIYRLTKIVPDLSIVYKNKSRLKRSKSQLRRIVNTGISVAASLAIMLSLYFVLSNKQVNNNEKFVTEAKEIIQNKTQNNTSEEPIINNTVRDVKNVEKINNIDKRIIGNNDESLKVKNKINNNVNNIEREYESIALLEPREIILQINTMNQVIKLHSNMNYYPTQVIHKEEPTVSLKTFIAQKVNKRLFKKEKDRIEMFDIAQAGVRGINKIAGTKMTLERIYDQNGNIDKTEFNSKLIAFSTPAKK